MLPGVRLFTPARVAALLALIAGILSVLTGPALAGTGSSTHAPVALVAPRITGTDAEGQTLTATAGTWLDSPTQLAYQWQRCSASGSACTAIAGATATTYALQSADVAATIRVTVTATNAGGSTASQSAATGPVLPLPPTGTTAPTIAGSATDGRTLTVAPGAWTGAPTRFAYQWQECSSTGSSCTAISGATTTTYTLTPSEVGNTLRVAVTATNAGGTGTQTSAVTAVIAPALVPWDNTAAPEATSPPSISGSPAAGQTVTCSPGAWTGDPTAYTYQWNRNNLPIAGATSPTYTVVAADQGHALTCSVVASNAGGAIQADSSAVTPGVAATTGQVNAGGAQACAAATGRVAGPRLGALSLGDTRTQVRRLLGHAERSTAGTDTFCVAGGGTIRAAYATGAPAARIARGRTATAGGGVVLALTTSIRYTVDGVRVGMTGRTAAHHHRLGRALRIGTSTWYVLAGARADGVVELHNGRVTAIGIANRRRASSPQAARTLLRRLG